MTRLRLLSLAAAAIVAAPALLRAQAVRGTIVDNGDRALSGVVVILLDPASKEIGRALSNDRGEFRLTAPRAGSYRIRTLRIGFQSVVTPPIALVEGADVTQRLSLAGVAFSLDTVRAVGRNVCRVVAGDSTSVVSAIWEQVRSALIATQLTLANRTLFSTSLAYQRKIDYRSGRIGQQTMDIRGEYVSQPWRSLSPDSLRKRGYVYTEANDVRVYNAPDLTVLISDEFIEDHCLRIADKSSDTRLGIEFEPTRDRRRIPEIRGTLWLNRATNELTEMEYRYVNVSKDEEDAAGGTMRFTRMRHGLWAISRWNIRMPMMVLVNRYDGMKVIDRSFQIDSIQVTGGELVTAVNVSSRTRDTVWVRPAVTLRGTVLDSLSGRPVPRAIVALGGTIQMDTTDAQGRFTIGGVLPGRYAINTSTPSLDSVATVDQRTILFSDSSMTMTLRVPNASQVVGSICGSSRAATTRGKGIIIGTVLSARDSAPVANATVRADWEEVVISSRQVGNSFNNLQTRTDARGAFRMCGVPVDVRMSFLATEDSVQSSTVHVRIPDGQMFARADLAIDRGGRSVAIFSGSVVDTAQGPLTDAEVQLPALGLTARTDARGNFRIQGIAPGTQNVVVQREGYQPVMLKIEFVAGMATERKIPLTRVPDSAR